MHGYFTVALPAEPDTTRHLADYDDPTHQPICGTTGAGAPEVVGLGVQTAAYRGSPVPARTCPGCWEITLRTTDPKQGIPVEGPCRPGCRHCPAA